ncbi:type I-B CRISPR-associated endonuclease Cas1 [Arachidicoccus ginsenosidivorans]|uniref:CRISPR-associated endonuclease Cas1 n=1 Tax=Arachidicoccus ginsenosidivorans TaxID=496057 RepID=A0A5B8VPZ1_9BACT|nr:type I-B CRISPR-associated endonuclease Cas1b [Arachidicoccus ginsenosidivorans]QEC72962.1 type I-B CRISPR-associated endonuclease Cas1 [Arachidicoccus ginsenosidivorans]
MINEKTYYLFNAGRLSRKDNTLKFTAIDQDGVEGSIRYIPIESVSDLFCFGALDANASLFNFLGKQQIAVHFFDFYEHYTGSFLPKEYLLAGKMQIEQTRHYISKGKRIVIASKFIEGASANILKNLRYYQSRGKDLQSIIESIEKFSGQIKSVVEIDELMGIEGNIRQKYYESFDLIINDFSMGGRSKQPPSNEINSLISFGNMMCYSLCLGQIYHTQMNPTISFLHEPGFRRFSLALDLSEIFKPILVDRVIFKVLNKREIQAKDFDFQGNKVLLKDASRKIFVRAFEERLNETIRHRSLNRNVSYKHLVKLECYKLTKHILGMEEYKPFKIWW